MLHSKALPKYFYLAQATPGLEHTLLKELKSYNIRADSLKARGIHELKFEASQSQMWRILFYSHTIDRLKLQVGPSFVARGDKELYKNLHRLPWGSFLPVENFTNYKIPVAKCKSYSSKLYHEGKVNEIVEKFINQLPYKARRYPNLSKPEQEYEETQEEEEIEDIEEAENQKSHRNVKHKDSKNTSSSSSSEPPTEGQTALKSLPTFYTYISKNNAMMAIDVVSESLHKHGFKSAIGWGSLRESIASSCLIETGIIDKAKETKSLKLWDPFCGGGTILLEAFLMFMDVPIRHEFEDSFRFKEWPVFDKKAYEEFKAKIEEKLRLRVIPQDVNVQLFGSDINIKELNKCAINFKTAQVSEYVYEDPSKKLQLGENNPLIRTEKVGEAGYLINSDFEIASKLIGNLEGVNILTNIPYGRRSVKYIEAKELNATYLRFSKFLKKNKRKLGDVFVICPEEADKVLGGFISISDMRWEKLTVFENQGIKVALFKLDKSRRIQQETAENAQEGQNGNEQEETEPKQEGEK